MLSAAAVFRASSNDLPAAVARAKARPAVERATATFETAAARIDDIDDFMADRTVYAYAMTAYGLGDMAYAKGLIREVLRQGTDSASDLANRLPDDRYRQLAAAFSFDAEGKAAFRPDTIASTADTYAKVSLEASAGALSEGARLALYFERKASTITSVLSILADASLWKVAQGALNIPTSAASLGIDAQAALVAARLDVTKLQDASFRAGFLKRFVASYDVATAAAQGGSDRLATLLTAIAGTGAR